MSTLRSRLDALRAVLPGPRALFAVAIAAIAAAALFNRDWLLAAGVSSLLLSVMPCLAMCALGLCMKGGGKSCAASTSTSPAGPVSTAAPCAPPESAVRKISSPGPGSH